MWTLIAVPITCWLCALLAHPKRPLPGNEVEELVYTRLLGRQHLLVLLAALVTAGAMMLLLVTLPQQIDPTLGESRRLNQYCAAAAGGLSSCYRLEPDGRWLEAAQQGDGQWVVIGTVQAPPMEPVPTRR